MLCSIHIKDLAVVESLELELHEGFTVLTGETGAGKSILLTAIGLALGDRADPGYIRPNCDKAEINLHFDLKHCQSASDWLEEHELADQRNCLVRRVLNRDGRSKGFINGTPVSLQMLQKLGEKLIDIHGQHAHLSLMRRDEQCRILDDIAGNQAILEHIRNLCQQWSSLSQELTQVQVRTTNAQERKQLAEFQILELEQSEVETLDYQALVDEHKLLANVEKVLSTGQLQLDRLEDNENQSVHAILADTIRDLSDFSGIANEFDPLIAMLNEARIQVQETAQTLRRYLDSLETDPRRFEALEQSLSLLHSLARKHQTSPETLPRVLNDLRQEMEQIEFGAERITQLEAQLSNLYKSYLENAATLSKLRKKAAKQLCANITETIRSLGMPHGDFAVDITPTADLTQPKSKGFDLIEYRVSTNPGLGPKPLSKIASGGELSRISLAIQVAVVDSNTTPTMIFDEVDAGIGGGVAEIVGQRLRALGKSRQVLCVTHLPQVAAQSHQHLLVEKISTKNQTRSLVRALSKEEIPIEIARMLGGIKITKQTLAHAQEMLSWQKNG